MKLVMIIADGDQAREVETVLDRSEIPGYTEFPTVLGKGATGRKMGTRAFPGSSTLYIAAVPAVQAEALVDELRALRDQAAAPGLKVFALQADQIL